jgi:nucleoid DNA-binding protein
MSVPEHSVVNFQAGKALKAGVWSTGYGKKKQLNI